MKNMKNMEKFPKEIKMVIFFLDTAMDLAISYLTKFKGIIIYNNNNQL